MEESKEEGRRANAYVLVVLVERLEPFRVLGLTRNLLQNLDLVVGRLQVVRSGFLDLERDVRVVLEVSRKPDCREMPPAEFLDDHVSLEQHLADVDGVVAAELVVLYSLVLAIIFLIYFLEVRFDSARIERLERL